MANTSRFGKKLKLPSTFQIKHQLLIFWLKRQAAKKVAEARRGEIPTIPGPMYVHEAS